MGADLNMIEQVLAAVPQKPPFRFIDEILGIEDPYITASYRFREDEFFYKGHFPGNPITPGVILIETMAQAGVTALGMYLLIKNLPAGKTINNITPLFVFVDRVEFLHPVRPGERVIIKGKKLYFRRGNIKSKTSLQREDGVTVCHGVLTGTGVKQS